MIDISLYEWSPYVIIIFAVYQFPDVQSRADVNSAA